jgi:DNA (cytosine-5)-methyltransferase 1
VSCPRCTADQAILRRADRPSFPDRDATFRLFDAFAGCGALSTGFLLAGLETGVELGSRLAIEHEDVPAATYAKNIGEVVEQSGIETVFDGELGAAVTPAERELKKKVGEVQLGLAGPPCQGHSDLNNHTRRADPRNALYAKVARAAAILEPKVICVENVPAVRNDHGGVLETTRTELERLGYDVHDEYIDMQLIGVPQRRRRHILLACQPGYGDPEIILDDLIDHPCSEHLPRDVRWAIEDIKGLKSEAIYDSASVPSEENRRRIAYLFEHGRYNLPNSLRPECHRDFEHTYNSMYGRLRWNKPAQTITSGYGSMGQGRYVHPGRRRTLTPHEAARLQTIPDWFDFGAAQTRTTLARMIGNAVPPLVGLDIGRLLLPLFVSAASEEADAGDRELRRAA